VFVLLHVEIRRIVKPNEVVRPLKVILKKVQLSLILTLPEPNTKPDDVLVIKSLKAAILKILRIVKLKIQRIVKPNEEIRLLKVILRMVQQLLLIPPLVEAKPSFNDLVQCDVKPLLKLRV